LLRESEGGRLHRCHGSSEEEEESDGCEPIHLGWRPLHVPMHPRVGIFVCKKFRGKRG
jgi:hypothetical protein